MSLLSSSIRSAATLVLLGACAISAGCSTSDAPAPAEEQALTEAKVLARHVSSPSGLAVVGPYIYFGSNHFVASGDPELDQQFAYWEGKFSRVPLAGGKVETVESVGPITEVKVVGSNLYYAMAQGCWISRRDGAAAEAKSSEVYHAGDECIFEDQPGFVGFEATASGLYVAKENGDIYAGAADGAGMKKIASVKIGNWSDAVEAVAMADDAMFIATRDFLTDAHDRPVKAAIYRVALATGETTKVLELERSPRLLRSDGTNIYWVADNEVRLLAKGTKEAKTIGSGFGSIIDLAVDGKKAYVADADRGSVYEIADALAAPSPRKKLASVKGVYSLLVSGSSLYVGSHVVENRKAAGTISAIALTP